MTLTIVTDMELFVSFIQAGSERDGLVGHDLFWLQFSVIDRVRIRFDDIRIDPSDSLWHID